MGLVVKMKKEGSIRNASYRIVVMEKKSHIHGKNLSDIGFLVLGKNNKTVKICVDYSVLALWLQRGAEITGRLRKYL